MQLRQQKYPFGSLRRDHHWSTKGLVLYSQFRPAGKLVDESRYGNHGTIVTATWVSGGLSFDGSDDYVDCGTAVPDADPMTVIVKFELAGGENQFDCIVGKTSGNLGGNDTQFALVYNTAGEYRCYLGDAGLQYVGISAASLAGQQINTVTITADAGFFKSYVNGVFHDQTVRTVGPLHTGGKFQIGQLFSAYKWPGIVYDVKYYSHALSSTEIAELYRVPDLPFQEDVSWMGMVAEEEPPEGIVPQIQYLRNMGVLA